MLRKFMQCWKDRTLGRRRMNRPTYRPFLEVLEDRLVPAVTTTWNWNVNNGLLPKWSLAGNWTNGVPGAPDTANFDGTSNTNCTVDVAVTIANLTIGSAYTSTIDNASGSLLTVTGLNSSMANGT